MSTKLRRLGLALAVASLALGVFAQAAPALSNGKAPDVGLKAIRDTAVKTLSAQNALKYTAYPYLGWRTSGGPWFNNCIDWLADELDSFGFVEAKTASGPHYWIQTDIVDEDIWAPQYAALEIVGPDGDAVPGQSYHFDFALDTFDPTSPYYPSSITYRWLKENIGTPAEAALNERCHLARNSPFTSPVDTPLAEAQAAARTGALIDVGVVTQDPVTEEYVWSKNTDVSLAGKFIYAAYDFATETGTRRSTLYGLAQQELAAGSLSPQTNSYNNPVIDGEELFPNTVKYAGVGGVTGGPLAFNISPMDGRYLEQLLAEATEPVMMKGMAIGSSTPYSAENPLRTLIAEIPGRGPTADEHIALLGHVQEPGACDNASGVGLQLEIARTMQKLIRTHQLPAPKRTFTFIWGYEMTMGELWKGQNPEAFDKTQAALVIDMVGEDPAKTGGPLRIEKMPDPAAVYHYGLDTLPGLLPEPVDAYVRLPDKHSLWGAGEVDPWPYPGQFLNDLYFASADLVNAISPLFEVGSNPWEGGSDHDTFLWNVDGDVFNPKPAALTWHFTDYVYHTSMDTMAMVSPREMRDVGLTTIGVGYLVASAGESQARQIMRIVQRKATWRFGWERMNSLGGLKWAYDKAVIAGGSADDVRVAVADALALELETLGAWGAWYEEAVVSPSGLLIKPSKAYTHSQNVAVRAVNRMTVDAKVNAKAVAAYLVSGL